MNQPILMNTTSAVATKNVAGTPAANNSLPHEKTPQGQAFSNELEKHIEKPDTNKSVKADRDVKKSDHDSAQDDVKAEKSENATDEVGKKLPEEKLDNDQTAKSTNDDVIAGNADTSEFVLPETDIDVAKVTDELELEQTLETSDELVVATVVPEVDSTVENDNNIDVEEHMPQGQNQTQALRDVVHTINQTVAEQKQSADETGDKTPVGKLVSDTVKNMTKPNDAAPTQTAVSNTQVESDEKAKVVATAASAAIEKESSSPLKLRPDIMQALSLRSGSDKVQATTNVSESAKLDAIIDKSSNGVKTANAQVQIPELLERINPKAQTTPAQSNIEKLGVNVTSLSLNPASGSGQIKADAPVLDIQPSLQNAAWSRVMTSRVLWMAREGVQQASLKLNPAQLGPVEVRLHVHQEQAQVTFIAQSAVTRDALEQALPRLRESFTQNGLELTNADVSQQSFGQANDGQEQQEAGLNSGSINQDASQMGDASGEQEQKIVNNEQELELGLSIYA